MPVGGNTAQCFLDIVQPVPEPSDEVEAAAFECGPDHLGIEPRSVRGREDIDPLANRKGDDLSVASIDSAATIADPPPPFLREKEGLVDNAERELVPGWIFESMVIRCWVNDLSSAQRIEEPVALSGRGLCELQAFE